MSNMTCKHACRWNTSVSGCERPAFAICPLANLVHQREENPIAEMAARVLAEAKSAEKKKPKKHEKRVNPRRIPVSRATVNKVRKELAEAKIEVSAEAINLAMALFLTTLCDKFNYDAEKLQKVWQEVNYLSDSVAKGYVSVEDLVEVLNDEYGIEIAV